MAYKAPLVEKLQSNRTGAVPWQLRCDSFAPSLSGSRIRPGLLEREGEVAAEQVRRIVLVQGEPAGDQQEACSTANSMASDFQDVGLGSALPSGRSRRRGTRDVGGPLAGFRPVRGEEVKGPLRPAGGDSAAASQPGNRFTAPGRVTRDGRDASAGALGKEIANSDQMPDRIIHDTRACHKWYCPASPMIRIGR